MSRTSINQRKIRIATKRLEAKRLQEITKQKLVKVNEKELSINTNKKKYIMSYSWQKSKCMFHDILQGIFILSYCYA